MNLNLGSGFRRLENFVNVDSSPACHPDVCLDLTANKWPWGDNSVDKVVFHFSLEEMGESKKDLIFILHELYRVCKNEAEIDISFWHPRHDQFFLNPLCVHRLSPEFFRMLSVQTNLEAIASGQLDTSLGLQLGVNFQFMAHKYLLAAQFQQAFESGQIKEADFRRMITHENNICHAVEVKLRAIKANEA